MKIQKKIYLIILGILLGLLLLEGILNLLQPVILNKFVFFIYKEEKALFNYLYIDIKKTFFKIKKDKFYIQRQDFFYPREKKQKYCINKPANKIRIFILGASTARNYRPQYIYESLKKYNIEAEIINIGMSGYDSYRIEKISKELKQFQPDWVICLIGNNDGINNIFSSMKIDPLDIKLPIPPIAILKYSYIYNYFIKEIKLDASNVEENFKNNINKILNNLEGCKIIFVDLPNNIKHIIYNNKYSKFSKCMSIIDQNNIFWKNSTDYKSLLSRIEYIKTISEKYNNVYVTNLTDYLNIFTKNNIEYNIFYDSCHWTPTTYKLLSQIITKIIVKESSQKDISIDFTEEQFNKKSIEDHDFPTHNIGFNNFGIKYNYNNLLNNVISFLNSNKEISSNDSANISIFSYCLYMNNHKKEAFEIIYKLLSLNSYNYEPNLILGYLYYMENKFDLAEKFFDITKALEPNSKIDVKYLNSISMKEQKL